MQIGLLEGRTNCSTWKYKMRILLKSIPGGLEVVDGNLCKPCSIGESVASEVKAQYEQELAKYTKADCSALIVLTTNMTEDVLKNVMRFSTAREVWLELNRLYDGISEDKAFNLCTEFFSYTKQQCDDVATHMSKLKHLWKQLKEEVTKNESGNYDLPDLFLICKILGTLPEECFPFKSSWKLISKRDRTMKT